MISVLTVCGNGIGSSLMLKMKIEEIVLKMVSMHKLNLSILTRLKVVRQISS